MLQLGTSLFSIAYVASPALHFFVTADNGGVDLSAGKFTHSYLDARADDSKYKV